VVVGLFWGVLLLEADEDGETLRVEEGGVTLLGEGGVGVVSAVVGVVVSVVVVVWFWE